MVSDELPGAGRLGVLPVSYRVLHIRHLLTPTPQKKDERCHVITHIQAAICDAPEIGIHCGKIQDSMGGERPGLQIFSPLELRRKAVARRCSRALHGSFIHTHIYS